MMAARFSGTATAARRASACSAFVGAFHHLGDDRRDEQRHAVGALVQRTHEGLVARERRRTLRDVVGDLGLGEGVEHDLLAQPVQAQLAPQGVERMVRRDHLGHAEGRQPHQAGAAAPPRDVVDELDRRAGRSSAGLPSPAAAAAARCSGPAARPSPAACGQGPRRPVRAASASRSSAVPSHGSCSSQVGATVRSSAGSVRVLAAQLGQRLQHRQIGLAGAVVLHALAARDGDASQARHEVLDQRGLADARVRRPRYRSERIAASAPVQGLRVRTSLCHGGVR